MNTYPGSSVALTSVMPAKSDLFAGMTLVFLEGHPALLAGQINALLILLYNA
jgi:hypothetical protein